MNVNTNARAAGILCHISSLPNKYGIGSLGKEAYAFVDFLVKAHVKYWQILPLVQTGFGDSPYQSVCERSGNPYFIDLEQLKDDGLLDENDLICAQMPEGEINYSALYESRYNTLRIAFSRFDISNREFIAFIESGVFEDYALFMSLKSRYSGSFENFPDAYKYKEQLAMYEFRNSVYEKEYCFWLFLQYEFQKQWLKLRNYANGRGIKIIGDIPLYVAYDSSDVWGRPEIFQLDEELKPTAVAGVPPDYFSKTGQLWGNPLYNWEALKAADYDWWIERIRRAATMYDVIRLDHFRGLDRYYAIPANAETAEVGNWENGPSYALFEQIENRLGRVDFIVEDLGVLDDGVISLRDKTGYPGMKILLFAFDGTEENAYLPDNIAENSISYTGTHDNNTVLGYINGLSEKEFTAFKKLVRKEMKKLELPYPFTTREQTARALCLLSLATKSFLSVIPVQDLLCLDEKSRMNTPSTNGGNWLFRLKEIPTRYHAALMRKAVKLTDR